MTKSTIKGIEIAVIGISCNFPKSPDHQTFWKNLENGIELIHHYPDDNKMDLSPDLNQGRKKVLSKAVINDKEFFDHAFFGYRAEDAILMDPQIRLFHEHCWKALEDAGCAANLSENKIGIFGSANESFNWRAYAKFKQMNSSVPSFYAEQISNREFMSSLVAYSLNLRGPAMYVSTACSSSLTAVHLACRSLLFRESYMALAGAAAINTAKEIGYVYEEDMILSADGHCRPFDQDANGTVPGEGVGVVVLKRLQDAIKDKDHIYAIIRSTALNNDGNQKIGFTAPSIDGQAECIKMAYQLAGVDPHSISYIEAHGTATKLGDPIEISALTRIFKPAEKGKFCAIGSVKSNLGHLDSAAGMAGLIKTVLSLKYKKIPPSLHYRVSNPEIDFDQTPFYVNTKPQQWEPDPQHPLRAAVSSFGIGGTNGHFVLEEMPEEPFVKDEKNYKLLLLSAKGEQSLISYIGRMKSFLKTTGDLNLTDAAYTLQTGREHFSYKKFIVCENKTQLIDLLGEVHSKGNIAFSKNATNDPIVFLFPGQGSQYVQMGVDLYANEPRFKRTMDAGFGIIEKITGNDFKEILYPDTEHSDKINETRYTQPLIFLFEYALAELITSYGINPSYMIGHSIGEYTAACISGVFSFEDALKLVLKRGRLMNDLPEGSMLSASLDERKAMEYQNDDISIAAVNSHSQIVFSGNTEAINGLKVKLDERGISSVKLHTSHAFHSKMLDPVLEDFQKELETITFNKPQHPFVSNLTGNLIKEEEACSVDYWVNHMRHTVRFSEGLSSIYSRTKDAVFIEIGAGNSLTNLLKQQSFLLNASKCFNFVRHPKEHQNDMNYFMTRLGQLWEHGLNINWELYYKGEERKKVSLPTYSFEKIRYTAEVDLLKETTLSSLSSMHTRGEQKLQDWIYYPVWKTSIPEPGQDNISRKSFLFFSSDSESMQLLKENLLQQHILVEVICGKSYEKQHDKKYIIDPANRNHFEKLFTDLHKDGFVTSDIIYSWNTISEPVPMELKQEDSKLNRIYFSIIQIVRQFSVMKSPEKNIFILTNLLHPVAGNETGDYAQSLSLTFLNTLSQEYSISCFNIDADLHISNNRAIGILVKEILSKNDQKNETVVALRNNQRWVRDYQKNSFPIQRGKRSVGIKENGIYLITGGLGNVGWILARYLIEQYNASVILTGRKNLDEEKNKNAKKRFSDLQGLSKKVCYHRVDTANTDQLEQMIVRIENEAGKINGIIHTAGNVDWNDFELIEDTTFEKSIKLFSPKIIGIENIYKLFKGRETDFVWMTSSISSILGGVSFSAYAAANLYMDHLVTSKKSELVNWKCVCLSEMLFDEELIRKENKNSRKGLIPTEICELFEWSLTLDLPVIIQTIEGLQARINSVHEKRKKQPEPDKLNIQPVKKQRSGLSTSYIPPQTETEKKIVKLFEEFFEFEQVGLDDNFFELGGDSLRAMILLKRMKQEFLINLTLKDFFESPTIRQITALIDEAIWINDANEKQFVTII